MNTTQNLIAVAATAAFLTISGVAAGGAHADTSETGTLPLSPTSQLPLSPASQQNALRSAEDYLDYSAFSREGLIEQLEYEGFSTSDAIFAVDNITVDWNAQAVKAAMDYLDYTSFSRAGLMQQLEYEGFTTAQAAHGVAATGL